MRMRGEDVQGIKVCAKMGLSPLIVRDEARGERVSGMKAKPLPRTAPEEGCNPNVSQISSRSTS